MATVSFDGQSFMIDGRRIWLVSGSIHYTRVPRGLWRSRIAAAKEAGLNCIDTYVFWNLHEPVPNQFNFEDDLDLRQFVELIGEAGMYCILRPGPFVDADCDFGGLPGWLTTIEGMKLREGDPLTPAFRKASARYLSMVMAQVRDLQATSAGGGPIVLMQAENRWYCHNPDQEQKYLREIVRYLRENGCSVPMIVSNNLWQRVEGTLDAWSGSEHLTANLRQLRLIQPDAPRLVSGCWSGHADQWGAPHQVDRSASHLSHCLAQILAAGGQYNLEMFHGGTNVGFLAGRTAAGPANFIATTYDCDAPLREGGGRGLKYDAVKRISTFASQFGHVFANLEPHRGPVAIAPSADSQSVSVIDQHGSQGHVVFLIKGNRNRAALVDVLLSSGLTIPVPLGQDRVAWILLETNLSGVAELTYTNLRPWAFVDRRMLVLFGPAGAEGVVCINGATLRMKVPKTHKPAVQTIEDIKVVVLNEPQVDAALITQDGLVIGADGQDDQGRPLPRPNWPVQTKIHPDRKTTTLHADPVRAGRAPRLVRWEQASCADLIRGRSARYKTIDGPSSLEALRCPFGYGWYHLNLESSSNQNVLWPRAADRLHLFSDGGANRIVGTGPAATDEPAPLDMSGSIVALADNLGRFSHGWNLGEQKGLFGHAYTVRVHRMNKPKLMNAKAPNPADIAGSFVGLHYGDQPVTSTLAWPFRPAGRQPVVLDIRDLPVRAMILINRNPIGMYDPEHSGGRARYLLEVGHDIGAGQNELRLALFATHDGKSLHQRHVRLFQCTQNLSTGKPWRFAPWTVPSPKAFGPITEQLAAPCWYRGYFTALHRRTPLWLQPTGMSKGQLFINGHNAGRYFNATPSGKAIGPQKRYYLPEPWLYTDRPNELLLFDEHGRSPSRCKLLYDRWGPYGK